MNPANHAIDAVREAAQPLTGASDDYDSLLELIGDARFMLIGEATHGTHDFYRERAQITKRLITEKDFSAVAVEARKQVAPAASRQNHSRPSYLQATRSRKWGPNNRSDRWV